MNQENYITYSNELVEGLGAATGACTGEAELLDQP